MEVFVNEYLRLIHRLLDNIYQYGPDTNTYCSVIPAMSPVSFCAGSRFAHYTGGVFCSFYDWYCDLPPGEPLTWGVQTESCECADWFNSKYIVLYPSPHDQLGLCDATPLAPTACRQAFPYWMVRGRS